MRIVLCYPLESHHVDQIRQAGDYEVVDAGQAGVAEALLDADIFCGHAKVPVDWPTVVAGGRLKWIQSSAAGLDHCLVPEVVASDILVSSASGLFAPQVAEQTLALLLGWLRGIPKFVAAQSRREFVRLPTHDLKGKTVGIVGLGGNGRRIAAALDPLDVQIVATDYFPVDCPPAVEQLWSANQLPELLAVSDIVILALPLTPTTKHIIGRAEFGQMKPGALLVNVARGAVVHEQELIRALQSNHLAGAALDVTESEPLPTTSALWDMPNVLITPHVGAQSANRVEVTTQFFCENLRRFQQGETLMNQVDKSLGFPRPEHRARGNVRKEQMGHSQNTCSRLDDRTG